MLTQEKTGTDLDVEKQMERLDNNLRKEGWKVDEEEFLYHPASGYRIRKEGDAFLLEKHGKTIIRSAFTLLLFLIASEEIKRANAGDTYGYP